MDNSATAKCNPDIGTNITQAAQAENNLREVVAKALKGCSKAKRRQQVASEISTFTGLSISKRMLDDWASPGKKGLRFPASLVKAFCEVTGDDSLALAVIPSHLNKYITVGKWLMDSKWVLDMISVKLTKRALRLLQISKVFKREIERRRQGK